MIPNISLSTRLALRNLRHHLLISAATVLGVAIGMAVVGAVLIVDRNTARTAEQQAELEKVRRQGSVSASTESRQRPQESLLVSVVRRGTTVQPSVVPTQERQASTSTISDKP